jgi:response regulator RpfG family c-di-GMP phosphodiesterase
MEHTGEWETVAPLTDVFTSAGPDPSLPLFLHRLAESRLLPHAEVERFLADRPPYGADEASQLGEDLIGHGLLTRYQLRRIRAGQTFGLVLGNYRVLDWLGSGGMGVVFKAEHVHMKRPVALKVIVTEDDGNAVFLQRFSSEMQALAVLRHPNIVLAFDAGEVQFPDDRRKMLRYLVMEYVPGENLEQYVLDRGPLPIPLACDFVRQAASGLRHAHEHGLVHRDIKPSNLLVTGLSGAGPHQLGQGQIKILDFGLARLCGRRCTAAYAMLGTVDYMAPEQARDARSVDIRADVYALGGTLYWLLTGHRPFPGDRPAVEELLARQYETPVPPRQHRPDIPLELEAIVCQMMARDPTDRYPTPLAVIAALNGFLEPPGLARGGSLTPAPGPRDTSDAQVATLLTAGPAEGPLAAQPRRVLVVSPRPEIHSACRDALDRNGLSCLEIAHEDDVAGALETFPADVVIVDARLAACPGVELCRRLRAEAPLPHLKLLLLAEGETASAETDGLCDDRVSADGQLGARVRMALRLREAEERADRVTAHLRATNAQLEQAVQQRDCTAEGAQDVLLFAMAKMAELRGGETAGHLLRMQQYARVLAEEAMRLPAFNPLIDAAFVRLLERCVLLHDIGKVAIPDHVLLKPGKLDAEERSIMESHTVLGANLLEAVARQQGACLAFLNLAIEIARSHHERYDGTGYPDGLMGDAIPLSARLVAIADVYDAMRSKLIYKPGLSHSAVRRLLLSPGQGQFDPALLVAFANCEDGFQQIFEQTRD